VSEFDLKMASAMATGVTDRLWSIGELIEATALKAEEVA
jgi:hypothetical protein